MRRAIATITGLLLITAPALAVASLVDVLGITSNSSTAWAKLKPGLYVVQIYAPEGTNRDATCTGGGAWDTASATVEYSPDGGVSIYDSAVSALAGAEADVVANQQAGRGYQWRLTVSSVGASTCLNFKMALSEE